MGVVDDFLVVFYTHRLIDNTPECKFAITAKINHLDYSNAKFLSVDCSFGRRSCHYYSHEHMVVHGSSLSFLTPTWFKFQLTTLCGCEKFGCIVMENEVYPIQVASRLWIYKYGEKTYPLYNHSSSLL